MANKVVIFPEAKQAEAEAYKAACDAHYAANHEPGGIFAYIRNDAFGQWVVPHYGLVLNGEPFDEPEGFAELRAEGMLHDTAVWSPEEE